LIRLISAESDISDGGRIYPMRWIYPMEVDISDLTRLLRHCNPTGSQICLMHQICPPWVGYIRSGTGAEVLEPNGNIRPGWIYPMTQSLRCKPIPLVSILVVNICSPIFWKACVPKNIALDQNKNYIGYMQPTYTHNHNNAAKILSE
jgi:hypothetical protein